MLPFASSLSLVVYGSTFLTLGIERLFSIDASLKTDHSRKQKRKVSCSVFINFYMYVDNIVKEIYVTDNMIKLIENARAYRYIVRRPKYSHERKKC